MALFAGVGFDQIGEAGLGEEQVVIAYDMAEDLEEGHFAAGEQRAGAAVVGLAAKCGNRKRRLAGGYAEDHENDREDDDEEEEHTDSGAEEAAEHGAKGVG